MDIDDIEEIVAIGGGILVFLFLMIILVDDLSQKPTMITWGTNESCIGTLHKYDHPVIKCTDGRVITNPTNVESK